MAKEISGFIKLQIKGGQANPAPPVGPALGQRVSTLWNFVKLSMIKQNQWQANLFQLKSQFIKTKNLTLKLNLLLHLTTLKKQ